MEKIPKQMVQDIVRYLDPSLINFFERTKQFDDYAHDSIELIVTDILKEIPSDSQFDIKLDASKDKLSRAKRRRRWISKVKENYEKFPINQPESVFFHVYEKIIRDPDGCMNIYGTTKKEEIILSFFDKMQVWLKEGGYLVNFPNFPYVGSRIKQKEIFLSDVSYATKKVIVDQYNGNVEHWSIKSLFDMEGIFSGERGSVPVEEKDGVRSAKLYQNDLIIPELIDDGLSEELRVFDDRDQLILSYLINNAYFDLKNPSPLQTIYTVSITELTKYVCNTKNYSTLQRDAVIERLKKLTQRIESRQSSEENYKAIVILDSLTINEVEGSYFAFYTLGAVVNNSVITNRIASLPSSTYRSLPEGCSRTLYCRMQLERITHCIQRKYTEKYTFDFFKRAMVIRSKSVKKVKSMITDSLQQLQLHTDLIEEMKFVGSVVEITFTKMPYDELNEILDANNAPLLMEKK